MRRLILFALGMSLMFPLSASSLTHYKTESYSSGGIKLDLSEPAGSIFRPGEDVRFAYRTDEDAYVIIFDIDTEGYVHLLYPQGGQLGPRSLAGRRYSIPEEQKASFVVEGETGMEFIFAIAVSEREHIDEDELAFLAESDFLPNDRQFRIDGDPFLAANMITGELVRGISQREGISIAHTYLYINDRVDYPRYICAECHDDARHPYEERCAAYNVSAGFRASDRLSYPLERGFEISAIEEPLEEPEGIEEDVEVTRVYVSFYPYDTYVYNRPLWVYSIWYDPFWYWDPFWYDPWYTCGAWYPYHPYYNRWSGFYFGFGWGWHPAYWDWGWHYWHYPYYRWHRDWDQYAYRPLRPHRPGVRYKSALHTAARYHARQDPDMRISNLRYKGKRPEHLARDYRGKSTYLGKGDYLKKPIRKGTLRDRSVKWQGKRAQIKRDRSHIYNRTDPRSKEKVIRRQGVKTKQPKSSSLRRTSPTRKSPKKIDRPNTKTRSSKQRKPRAYLPPSRRSSEKPKAVKGSSSSRKRSPPSSMKRSSPSRPTKSAPSRSYRPPARSSSPKARPARPSGSGGSKGKKQEKK